MGSRMGSAVRTASKLRRRPLFGRGGLRTCLRRVPAYSGKIRLRPEPEGFAARVARTACSLCKGWCCRNGEDTAFLDETTMARVRCARSALDVRAVLRLYVERVPQVGFEDSCIFYGKQGCTLDRSLRSNVCNSYFCGGLQGYMTGGDTVTPTMIIAGAGDQMRTSPILMP